MLLAIRRKLCALMEQPRSNSTSYFYRFDFHNLCTADTNLSFHFILELSPVPSRPPRNQMSYQDSLTTTFRTTKRTTKRTTTMSKMRARTWRITSPPSWTRSPPSKRRNPRLFTLPRFVTTITNGPSKRKPQMVCRRFTGASTDAENQSARKE